MREVRKKLKWKQGPWRNAVFWLSLQGLLSLLSYTPEDHLPSGDTAHGDLDSSTFIINQENSPQVNLRANRIGAVKVPV